MHTRPRTAQTGEFASAGQFDKAAIAGLETTFGFTQECTTPKESIHWAASFKGPAQVVLGHVFFFQAPQLQTSQFGGMSIVRGVFAWAAGKLYPAQPQCARGQFLTWGCLELGGPPNPWSSFGSRCKICSKGYRIKKTHPYGMTHVAFQRQQDSFPRSPETSYMKAFCSRPALGDTSRQDLEK